MNRPSIEQLEENLTNFPYGDIGGEVALQLIDYIKELKEEIEYLKNNQRTERLVFGDVTEEKFKNSEQTYLEWKYFEERI